MLIKSTYALHCRIHEIFQSCDVTRESRKLFFDIHENKKCKNILILFILILFILILFILILLILILFILILFILILLILILLILILLILIRKIRVRIRLIRKIRIRIRLIRKIRIRIRLIRKIRIRIRLIRKIRIRIRLIRIWLRILMISIESYRLTKNSFDKISIVHFILIDDFFKLDTSNAFFKVESHHTYFIFYQTWLTKNFDQFVMTSNSCRDDRMFSTQK
jgi:hypothetical protein